MKSSYVFTTAVLVLSTLLTTSCNSKKSKSVAAQQLDIVEPFDLTFSEGGGMTGIVESYHIASTGNIDFFKKYPGQQDSLVWSKQVPTNELAKLQQSLLSSNILSQPLNERGNMTSNLTYTTADTSYSLSWAGVGGTSEMSSDMKQWLAQLKTLLQTEK